MGCVGGGEGGATLVWALETDAGVDCFAAPGGLRRGAPFGAAFLPATAELISVDISVFTLCSEAHFRHVTEAWMIVVKVGRANLER